MNIMKTRKLNIMKKLLLLFLLAPSITMAQAPVVPPTKHAGKAQQNTIKPELRNYVAEVLNSQCPYDIGSMTVTKYYIDGNNVVIVYSVDENIIKIDDIRSASNEQKETLLSVYRYAPELKHFVNLMAESKAGLVNLYIGSKSHKQCRVVLFSKEIASAAKVKDSDKDPLRLLTIYVESYNERLPEMIDNGIMNTRVLIENFYVVYEYVLDEDIHSVEQWIEEREERKNNFLKTISTIDGQEKTEFMIIVMAKKGIIYRYIGDVSGKTCEIRVNAVELRNALNSN